jgi:hypothetical protein
MHFLKGCFLFLGAAFFVVECDAGFLPVVQELFDTAAHKDL